MISFLPSDTNDSEPAATCLSPRRAAVRTLTLRSAFARFRSVL